MRGNLCWKDWSRVTINDGIHLYIKKRRETQSTGKKFRLICGKPKTRLYEKISACSVEFKNVKLRLVITRETTMRISRVLTWLKRDISKIKRTCLLFCTEFKPRTWTTKAYISTRRKTEKRLHLFMLMSIAVSIRLCFCSFVLVPLPFVNIWTAFRVVKGGRIANLSRIVRFVYGFTSQAT